MFLARGRDARPICASAKAQFTKHLCDAEGQLSAALAPCAKAFGADHSNPPCRADVAQPVQIPIRQVA